MTDAMDRRNFVTSALAFAASSVAPGAGARSGAATPIELRSLATDVDVVTGSGSNVVLVRAGKEVVMVDGGLAVNATRLLQRVRAGGQSVSTLFNTHWHWDHTGSNEALGKSGVRIIAHENTKLWMQRPIDVKWEGRVYPPVTPKALPTQTFYTQDSLRVGTQEIRYGHLGQAHTDGDLYVHLPAANVLVAGDVVSVNHYPVMDWSTGGWVGGLLDATSTLLALSDDNTLIVPGTGPVVNKAQLKLQHDMLEVMKERVWQLMRKGMNDVDVVAAKPTAEYDEQWGDPQQFLLSAYKGLWGHVREQRGIV
jgi:cyclase